MENEHVGLRAIKKQMTRDSIAAAALRLTEKKGLSDVTLEDIAREAFVSPRTVSNYFVTKEEAVVAGGAYSPEQLLEEFSSSPTDAPPLKTLCQLLSRYAREYPERMHRAAKLWNLEENNPSLRPFRVSQDVQLVEVLTNRIAARTGTDLKTDLYPALVASAAASAMVSALAIWNVNKLPDERLPELIEDAFNILTAGYPQRLPSSAEDAEAEAADA
ncbi:TetR/AcrR family transcriptional regulator [Nesterenkonia halotolerans]|uniref:TetR/AcrR family transcriptional regulator n=1 Tax=Nesterenkonia halotolerans TaxID=225325 RepID=UPI003EE64AF0